MIHEIIIMTEPGNQVGRRKIIPLIMAVALLIIFVYGAYHIITNLRRQVHPEPAFRISNLEYKIIIDNQGNGVITRRQIIYPDREVPEIVEMDFHSSGSKLNSNQFVYTVTEIDPRNMAEIGNTIYECKPEGECNNNTKELITYINPILKPGHVYLRTLTWTAEMAYLDSQSDYATFHVNYPTDELSINITLDYQAQSFDTVSTVTEYRQLKSAGVAIWGESVPSKPIVQLRTIDWSIKYPFSGDSYYIKWKYRY